MTWPRVIFGSSASRSTARRGFRTQGLSQLTSTSNCNLHLQAPGWRPATDASGKPQIAATLNGTLATTRWLVAS